MPTDCLIEPRWLVPVRPSGTVFEGHAVAIVDGRIAALGPTETLRRQYPDLPRRGLADHVLIPGLVNAHTHAAMSLMRGLADDLPLMQWLQQHIWPAEARHVGPAFVFDGTLLAAAEMLRGGVTCMNDMYFFPEDVGRAALSAGMRAALGLIVIDFPTAYATDAQDYLAKGIAMRDALKHEERLSFCMAPHAPYTVGDATLERVVMLAEQLQLPIHMHVHETVDEIREHVARHAVRPLERMRRLGLLGPGFLGVHSVHLDEDEIALFAAHGCSVAHCPVSNLKLASGIAPVAALLDAGVNIALGTDGAASNNRLDLFQEMRTAALLAKATSGRADAFGAHRALEAATLGGAIALGLEAGIGSIEPGKAADLTAVNLSRLELAPVYDPVSHLVYAAGREDVTDVWVGGEPVLTDRMLTRIDETELLARARHWQTTLAAPTN
ncbi:MAG: TRZ/ATZ family hydrolase [Burkholderiales bacterium]|nr:TRZ/ATZ family hydrolase [Burkholderiales bacterium]